MIIGIDFDGTLNEMLPLWIETLNKKYDRNVDSVNMPDWRISELFPGLNSTQLFEPLNTYEFWSKVKIKPNAVGVVEQLIYNGHKVFIVTSSHYSELAPKLEMCLFKYFPFLGLKDVIITYHKELINCDVMIDDLPHNLTGRFKKKILFDTPYNQNEDSPWLIRAYNWLDVYKHINEA